MHVASRNTWNFWCNKV